MGELEWRWRSHRSSSTPRVSSVRLQVPKGPVGQSVLRRTVRAVCAGTALPLDRVDDLMIICDELLARGDAEEMTFTFLCGADGIGVQVPIRDAGPIVGVLASEIDLGTDEVTVHVRPRSLAGPGGPTV